MLTVDVLCLQIFFKPNHKVREDVHVFSSHLFKRHHKVREGTIGFTEAPGDHYYRSTYWPITKERGWRGGMRNRLVDLVDNFVFFSCSFLPF